MSRVQKLRVFVSQRINAALEEILTVFEKTIIKYEEEAALSQQVISRQHALLCALHKPLMDVPSADVFTQQLLLRNQETPPEHQVQVQNQVLNQEDPEPPHIKEEQEGEPLQDLDEADIIQFTYNPRRAARSGEDMERAEPGSVGPDQQVQLVSSETEDSDDYGNDSTDLSSASKQPKAKRRRRAGGRFSCRVCIRTFKARRSLFRHVRAHLQEAEPICGLCGEQFEAADGLRLHIQTHWTTQRRKRELETQTRTRTRDLQPDTNPRPHTCDDCGQSFLQVWKKKRHRCPKNQEIP